jgi:hypothetical protein
VCPASHAAGSDLLGRALKQLCIVLRVACVDWGVVLFKVQDMKQMTDQKWLQTVPVHRGVNMFMDGGMLLWRLHHLRRRHAPERRATLHRTCDTKLLWQQFIMIAS